MRLAIVALQDGFDARMRIKNHTADAGMGNQSLEAVFLQGSAADMEFPHDFSPIVIPFAAKSGPAGGLRSVEAFGHIRQQAD